MESVKEVIVEGGLEMYPVMEIITILLNVDGMEVTAKSSTSIPIAMCMIHQPLKMEGVIEVTTILPIVDGMEVTVLSSTKNTPIVT